MESSRFFSVIVGCIFLAICAYIGAGLYSRIGSPKTYAVSYVQLEETVELQGIVLRQEQSLTLGRGEVFAAQSGQRLAAGELLTLGSKGQGLCAPCSGIYYDSTDGFEYLSIDDIQYEDICALDALLDAKSKQKADGRLVTSGIWYYWAIYSGAAALPVNGSCKLQFDGFEDEASAQLIGISSADDGRQALLLRLNQGSEEYLSLRKVGARLLIGQHSGLYVPLSAITADGEGNEFVYILNAGAYDSVPVELIYTGSDFALVKQSDSGIQVGDLVVIAA